MTQSKPTSVETDNHPPQPRTDDAVLGGTAPSPVGCVVLGGLEGVKRRLAAAAIEQRLAALQDALQYGEAGLELVMLGLEDKSWQVQHSAFSLLTAQDLPKVKQRLRNLLPFEFEVVEVDAWGQESNRYRKQSRYFLDDLGNGVLLEMVAIPGGTFLIGSPSSEKGRFRHESRQNSVTVKPFYLGKFTVTQQQWRAVAALPQVSHALDCDPSYFKGHNLPVEQVSSIEAIEFCERLSKKTGRTYRLPREVEWEYACRAGTNTPFHFGKTMTSDLANYNGNCTYASEPHGKCRKKTTQVGSFQVANAFGLYDMHGNVWEWCADLGSDHYQSAHSDGSVRFWEWCADLGSNHYQGASSDGSVRLINSDTHLWLRGGSWYANPANCRSACRSLSGPGGRHHNSSIGFRVVCAAA
jgi:formylglycine-generating enzyme required for sulfatase activity